MELRHLRYFVAIAETGSLTLAAEKRLRTAQPSLSRQIRDLEYEVGVQLLNRSPQGTKLTAAGQAFLRHARLSLAQADAGSVTSRPLAGEQPTIDLMIGYHRANTSPILEKFLCGIDHLSAQIYGKM
jgi:LysR family transcriptional regulator, hca operon transcriptional activator